MDALRDHQYHRTMKEEVKEEVAVCGFVEVDSHDVHQLCTACLCATRTTHMLDDDTLKQYYMNILTETQLQTEGDAKVLLPPRLCWECVIHLKSSVRFREQVQDSYRLLQPMLLTCDKEDLAEFLQTSVTRPGRLRTCFAHSINISAQDDDTQELNADKHDDDDGDVAAKEYSERYIEASPSTLRETVASIDEESFESFCDKNIVASVSEDLHEQLEETDAYTNKQVSSSFTTINTSNSTDVESTLEKSTFVCDYCHKMFTKTALERHIATYDIYPHNNKAVTFPCEDCVVVLCSDNQCSECSNGHRLLQHINMKTNNKVAKKYYKSKLYQNQPYSGGKGLLLVHKRTQYKGEKPFQCEVCHKSFSEKSGLIAHIRSHTGEKPFQCEVCHKSFVRKSQLIRHGRTHTGEKPFQCEVCHKLFNEKCDLVRHIRTQSGEKPFQCELCQKSFVSTSHLIIHTRTHSGEKPFQCEVCHKSFSLQHNLVTHRRTHTGEKPFQCEVCHKSFSDQSGLIVHIRKHTGEKPFHCEVCLKTFSVKFSLITHIRTHTGEKPFHCEVCLKKFSNQSYLIRHRRTHTGEKPFQCEVCHKSFSEHHKLVNHRRTHTGEKPFQCEVCHKTFSGKPGLIEHIRTHTGEKPFQCEVCHKSFVTKSQLIRHRKTHWRVTL